MKRILPLIALLCAFAVAPAFASWSYVDGSNLWITDGAWTVKLTKTGSNYYISGWADGSATLDLSTVTADLAAEATPHAVTIISVGSNAFKGCTVLETLVLPDSCTTVNANSFQGCTSLATARMPGVTTFGGANSFNGCSSLSTVECPNLSSIAGYGAFGGCTSLVELKVSGNLSRFDANTFQGCTSFTTLYTNDNTKVVGHVQLPPGVTALGSYNFYQTKITHVFAPGVTSLNSGNGYTFGSCSLLQEVHLPSLAGIASVYAFSGDSALRTVEISSALSGTIANCAFSSCTSLESIYQSGNEPIEGLVDLPAGVTKFEWAAFMNCATIEHVVAPGVVNVQNRAFVGCSSLKTVRFSPNLAVLASNKNGTTETPFYNCKALTDFFPSTMPCLTQIHSGTFNGDSSLTNSFDFSGATLADVPAYSFLNGASKVPCVKLPVSFAKLYEKEFCGLKPGAEIHFTGNIPSKGDSKNDQMYQGKDGAGYRYRIFADAGTYPAWTNLSRARRSRRRLPRWRAKATILVSRRLVI